MWKSKDICAGLLCKILLLFSSNNNQYSEEIHVSNLTFNILFKQKIEKFENIY